ncbi:uncharacterized protein LOC126599143 [Malus sylvestris]|uniref:uncharacterized protein LOC126599143 n=1 Tax=Malus sylvestris TaxID=3752 RepID=UPI0021AC3450|nr:uncharacterized protein LOC126599143 [Malus sylvestris]
MCTNEYAIFDSDGGLFIYCSFKVKLHLITLRIVSGFITIIAFLGKSSGILLTGLPINEVNAWKILVVFVIVGWILIDACPEYSLSTVPACSFLLGWYTSPSDSFSSL